MLRKLEKKLNNRLVDFVIGGSYLGDFRTRNFEKIKKIGLEAHAHILALLKRLKKRYRE